MANKVKSAAAIAKMRIAGRLAAEVLEMLTPYVVEGVSTAELDARCERYIIDVQKAIPACLGYLGYPNTICTSVNYQVCHGIPNTKPLKNGDIVNIDVTVIKDKYHGDTSKMFLIGDCSIAAKRLSRVTQECLYQAIRCVRPGAFLGDIGACIQNHAHQHQYSVVEDYCGHGIGLEFHEKDFQVLHIGRAGTGLKLEAGMTFTIEPMINAGRKEVKQLNDGWTVITKDRQLSAQWEHTILVTQTGFEVLTLREEEKKSFDP